MTYSEIADAIGCVFKGRADFVRKIQELCFYRDGGGEPTWLHSVEVTATPCGFRDMFDEVPALEGYFGVNELFMRYVDADACDREAVAGFLTPDGRDAHCYVHLDEVDELIAKAGTVEDDDDEILDTIRQWQIENSVTVRFNITSDALAVTFEPRIEGNRGFPLRKDPLPKWIGEFEELIFPKGEKEIENE
jgi:hypothetical protein